MIINNQKVFFPKQTIIKNEFLYTKNKSLSKDWDVSECTNFVENPGNWLKANGQNLQGII